ncbi:MAG TPA: tetratricopeptide repeat protein, partial [Polyangiaceae bacterium]|nr:tetratricopeptide repeat protein [Polyangiaceae bacterium]
PRDPESMAWCFVDLGDIYRERGDAQRALRAAQRALELVPNYHPALVLEAQAHLLAGDAKSARRPLERAVKRHPRVQDLLLLAEISDAKERNALLGRAEALAADDPRPLALYYARHAVKAERAVELAELELEARHGIEAHAVHALALVRAGRHADAERAIGRALALGTQDADLYLYRALARWAAGDREGAVNALSRALEINPAADPLLATELSTKLSPSKLRREERP